MSRYNETKIKKSKPNELRNNIFNKYDTTIYNEVPESDNDIFIITQDGDRLDNLAFRFYGDSKMWWFIAQTNNINTMNLEPNTRLRISTLTDFAKGR